MRFGGEKRWQRERITNWKHEIFEYLRSSPFSHARSSPFSHAVVPVFPRTVVPLIELREKKEKGGLAKRWAGDRNHYSSLEQVLEKKITNADLEYGAIAVKPGMYKIMFNSLYCSPPSGYYGKSSIVEIKQGERVVIPVPLIPAI